MKVYYGPIKPLPSFQWVGKDIFDSIEKDEPCFDIQAFARYTDNLKGCTIVVIKDLPKFSWLIRQRLKNNKIIFIPVDIFRKRRDVIKSFFKLIVFNKILFHNYHLYKQFFFIRNTSKAFTDHYLKYTIERSTITAPFVLWIGHQEYIPSLLRVLRRYDLGLPVIGLSDIGDKFEASLLDKYLCYCLKSRTISGNNLKIETWTEERQKTLMSNCRFAIDTKDHKWDHTIKPPTKVQQYLANKIPVIVESQSYAYKHFHSSGFNLMDFDEFKLEKLATYQDKVIKFSRVLEKTLSKDTITRKMVNLIKQ